MAYFAFESYLNLSGPRVDPKTWQNERSYFNQSPYQGTLGKAKWIADRVGLQIEMGQRPYQTISELSRLRNFLTHGRIEAYGYDVLVRQNEEPDLFRNLTIYKLVNRRKADQALKDTEKFANDLHTKVMERVGDNHQYFKGKPFEYPLAAASSIGKPD